MAAVSVNPLDFALRVCESIAFTLHGILGLTEPFTGCVRATFQDNGALPTWFWPTAGALLLGVAAANFSSNDGVILAAQAYIVAFHIGGVLYHRRLGHHPAAAVGPGTFVVLAFIVAAMRSAVWMAAVGTLLCAAVAAALCRLLVTPLGGSEGAHLLGGEASALE